MSYYKFDLNPITLWLDGERSKHNRSLRKRLGEEFVSFVLGMRSRGEAHLFIKADSIETVPPKPPPKPRRRHSREGAVRCDICAPLRCRYA